MPHEPGHNGNTTQASYKIVGTDKTYDGLVVMIGGHPYTTDGGTLQGNSQQLELVGNNNTSQTQTQNDNPVTRTFISRVLYYRQDGTTVPVGTEMHEHADGTIMLGHDPENMGEIVTRTSTQRTQTQRTQTQRTRTSTGGMGGGRTGGGRSGY
jgi:hypothetical protein